MTRVQTEYTIAAIVAITVIAFLLNAIIHARAAVRDDLRRADITTLKRGAERYFNKHKFYPTSPDKKTDCTSTSDMSSWLFGSQSLLLKEQHIDAIPHDVREDRGYTYRYCITDLQNNAAAGYYFEAQLEVNQPDVVALDEDETRNFTYRVLHEDGKILYRVCGGTETQCQPKASAAE